MLRASLLPREEASSERTTHRRPAFSARRLIREFARRGRGPAGIRGWSSSRTARPRCPASHAGATNQEVAALSPRQRDDGEDTHVAHLLGKLELRDRVLAVIFAYESGLVGPASS